MISVASKCGYGLEKAREGTNVLKDRMIITVIPKSELDRLTAKGILKVLATGKPSFRPERFKKVA